MVRFSPAQLDAERWLACCARADAASLFIASSQAEVENEVHVTVGVVRYDVEGRARAGGASGFLMTAWKKRAKSAYLSNITITSACRRIPNPVIMIGPGHPVLRRSAPLCNNAPPTKRRVKLAVLW